MRALNGEKLFGIHNEQLSEECFNFGYFCYVRPVSFIAEISGHPENYLFSLSKTNIFLIKVSKKSFISLQKRKNCAWPEYIYSSHTHMVVMSRYQQHRHSASAAVFTSVAFLSEASVRSPPKLLYFTIKIHIRRITVSNIIVN